MNFHSIKSWSENHMYIWTFIILRCLNISKYHHIFWWSSPFFNQLANLIYCCFFLESLDYKRRYFILRSYNSLHFVKLIQKWHKHGMELKKYCINHLKTLGHLTPKSITVTVFSLWRFVIPQREKYFFCVISLFLFVL